MEPAKKKDAENAKGNKLKIVNRQFIVNKYVNDHWDPAVVETCLNSYLQSTGRRMNAGLVAGFEFEAFETFMVTEVARSADVEAVRVESEGGQAKSEAKSVLASGDVAKLGFKGKGKGIAAEVKGKADRKGQTIHIGKGKIAGEEVVGKGQTPHLGHWNSLEKYYCQDIDVTISPDFSLTLSAADGTVKGTITNVAGLIQDWADVAIPGDPDAALNCSFDVDLLAEDFSLGKENRRIPVIADCPGARRWPFVNNRFRYLKSNFMLGPLISEKELSFSLNSGKCSCYVQCCAGVVDCHCIKSTTGKTCAYVGDALTQEYLARVIAFREKFVFGQPIIKECFNGCPCPFSCLNRLVQRGLTLDFQVCSDRKGFWVRNVNFIPRGTFLFEYTGELVTKTELKARRSKFDFADDFVVALDKGHLQSGDCLYLDSNNFGNVARFLIKGDPTSANVVGIPVLMESNNQSYYHLSVFSLVDLPPMTTLFWDVPEFAGFSSPPPKSAPKKNVKSGGRKYVLDEAKGPKGGRNHQRKSHPYR